MGSLGKWVGVRVGVIIVRLQFFGTIGAGKIVPEYLETVDAVKMVPGYFGTTGAGK